MKLYTNNIIYFKSGECFPSIYLRLIDMALDDDDDDNLKSIIECIHV